VAASGDTRTGDVPGTAVVEGRFQMSEVTDILSALEQGGGQTAPQLLPLVYEELRRLAALLQDA